MKHRLTQYINYETRHLVVENELTTRWLNYIPNVFNHTMVFHLTTHQRHQQSIYRTRKKTKGDVCDLISNINAILNSVNLIGILHKSCKICYILSPDRRQAIIWTNADLLLIWPLGTNFNAIWIKSRTVWKYRLRNGGHFITASVQTPMREDCKEHFMKNDLKGILLLKGVTTPYIK